MPSLRKLLPLILVMLIVTWNTYAQSLKPSPRQAPSPSEERQLIEKPTQKNSPQLAASDPSQAPEQTPASDNHGSQSQGESGWMIFFVALTAIATFALAVFNFQLVGVTDEMKKATAEAAQAAKESVQLAERSLSADRPLIRTETPEIKNFYEQSQKINAVFRLKNWGKGPAFITQVCAVLGIIDSLDFPYPAGEEPPKREFPSELSAEDMLTSKLENDVLLPTELSDRITVPLYLPPKKEEVTDEDRVPHERGMTVEIFARLTDPFTWPDSTVNLRVRINYVDVAQNPYWTEWNWRYRPGSDADDGTFLFLSYRDSQQRHEAKKLG
jgi:hypothetical protein